MYHEKDKHVYLRAGSLLIAYEVVTCMYAQTCLPASSWIIINALPNVHKV